jgi:hypothetical protein
MAKGNKTLAFSTMKTRNPHHILALQEKLRKKGLKPNKNVTILAETALIINSNVKDMTIQRTNEQREKTMGHLMTIYKLDESVSWSIR